MKTGAKRKICQALLELADGKSAQDVTVSELIARAGINRSTFYYHFTGTHEVLEYMMEDFCAQYLSALMIPRGEVAKSISKSSQDALEKGVCDYIRKAGMLFPFFFRNRTTGCLRNTSEKPFRTTAKRTRSFRCSPTDTLNNSSAECFTTITYT